jgi:hypothetical protein
MGTILGPDDSGIQGQAAVSELILNGTFAVLRSG